MNLYLKHRPTTLDEIRGNMETIEVLARMLNDQTTCPHSFLLYGPKGCGKTTVARIIADQLGCIGNDFRELNSADFRGIDTIRELRQRCHFKPLEGRCRVWLMDEAHKLTNDAQNALLKLLEDTPQHVYFILCTTDPHKLLPTVRDRCTQFPLQPLNEHQMFGLLRSVVKAENENMPKLVYEQITQDSFGHPRSALQILDQVLRVDPEKRLEVAKRSAEEQSQSIELCRALLKGAPWKQVANILNGLKDQDPEGIRRHVLAYCQSVLLKSDNIKAGLIMEEFIDNFFNSGFSGLIYACYSVTKN